jgi:hypothetical protein
MAGMTGKLARRAIAVSPIKAPAMNITLGSIGVLSLATVLTVWKEAFEYLFGNAALGIRRDVLIATMAAIVTIAAVDMLARAIASRNDNEHVVPWGGGWTASIAQAGLDKQGYVVAGLRARASAPESIEYLLVKDGEAPLWHSAASVHLKPPEA